MAPLVTPAASTMSCTEVPSKPCRAKSRVATRSSRSFTGRPEPGRAPPAGSFCRTAISHAPRGSRRLAPYRPVGLTLGTQLIPGQLPGQPCRATRLRLLSRGQLVEVSRDVLHLVAGPVAARTSAALLPRQRTGERPELQAGRGQP